MYAKSPLGISAGGLAFRVGAKTTHYLKMMISRQNSPIKLFLLRFVDMRRVVRHQASGAQQPVESISTYPDSRE